METTGTITLAAVQAAPVWLDRAATVEKACRLIAEAGEAGADLVGFPENFIPGHPNWYYYRPATSPESLALSVRLFQESVEVPGEDIDRLRDAARRAGVNVVMGVTERVRGTTGTLFNTQIFLSADGELAGKRQKLVPTISERLVHAPGGRDTQMTFQAGFGTVSALACGENSNPLAVAMIADDYPVVHVASWPNHFIPGGGGLRAASELAGRNIAYMAKCFVINSCSPNGEDMIADCAVTEEDVAFLRDPSGTGGSSIIDPQGRIIAGPMDGDAEGIVYATVDLDVCVRGRMLHDVSGHYNRPDVFQLTIDTTPSLLVARRGGDAERHAGGSEAVDGDVRGDARGRAEITAEVTAGGVTGAAE